VDIAKAFVFVTEDEEWITKLAIALLVSFLSFLIIPLPLLVGYAVGITRNVRNGLERPLPDWNDLGGLFRDGLSVMAAQLVYTLPFWLLACIVFLATIGFGGVADAVENPDVLGAGLAATIVLVACVSVLFGIALMFISPAIVLQYVETNELAAMLRVREVLQIVRDNIGDIVIVLLVGFGAGLGIGVVTGVLGIIPCLGPILAIVIGLVTGPYLLAVNGHLYGQIAAKIGPPKSGMMSEI
jgi:hypothetical protein